MTFPARLKRNGRHYVAWLGLLAGTALLTAGCFRTEISIEFEEDGTGFVGFLIGMDQSIFGAFDDFDFDDDDDFDFDDADMLEEFQQLDLPDGTIIEPYVDGNLSGVRVRVPVVLGEDDVARIVEDLFGGVDADEFDTDDGVFDFFSIERDGDAWLFQADMSGDGDDDMDALELGMMQAMFPDDPFIVRVKLPGQIVDTNADEVLPDGTMIWSIDIFSSETRELRAVTSGSGAAPPPADDDDDAAEADAEEMAEDDAAEEMADDENGDAAAERDAVDEDADPADDDAMVADAADDDGGISTAILVAIGAIVVVAVGAAAFIFGRRGSGAAGA